MKTLLFFSGEAEEGSKDQSSATAGSSGSKSRRRDNDDKSSETQPCFAETGLEDTIGGGRGSRTTVLKHNHFSPQLAEKLSGLNCDNQQPKKDRTCENTMSRVYQTDRATSAANYYDCIEAEDDGKQLRGVRFAPAVDDYTLGFGQELDEIEFAKKLSLGLDAATAAASSSMPASVPRLHNRSPPRLTNNVRPSSPFIPVEHEDTHFFLETTDVEEQRALMQAATRQNGCALMADPPPSILKATATKRSNYKDDQLATHDKKMPAAKQPSGHASFTDDAAMEEDDVMAAIRLSLQDSDPRTNSTKSLAVRQQHQDQSSRTMVPYTQSSRAMVPYARAPHASKSWLARASELWRPAPPQNDRGGTIVVQGTKSQYTWEGGEVACTSICLVAAKELLSMEPSGWHVLHPKTLDSWVEQGIARHHAHGKKHSCVEQIWVLQLFADIAKALEMGCPYQGNVADRNNLRECLQKAHDFAFKTKSSRSLAVIFTKSGETVLCVCSRVYDVWMFLDSHGQSHETDKRIYLKCFASLDLMVAFLAQKYPAQGLGDGSLQSEMYNLFECFPLVVREDAEEWDDIKKPGSFMGEEEEHDVLCLSVFPVQTQSVAPSAPFEDEFSHVASEAYKAIAKSQPKVAILETGDYKERAQASSKNPPPQLAFDELVREELALHAKKPGDSSGPSSRKPPPTLGFDKLLLIDEPNAKEPNQVDRSETADQSDPHKKSPEIETSSKTDSEGKDAGGSEGGGQGISLETSSTLASGSGGPFPDDSNLSSNKNASDDKHNKDFESSTESLRKPPPISNSLMKSNSEEMRTDALTLEPSAGCINSSTKEAAPLSQSEEPSLPQVWQYLLQKKDFEDPITYQIMADPVTCEDGHTYDRPVIQRCFRERVLAEEERQKKQSENNSTNVDDTSCGGVVGPIALISPVTGSVVSGSLVPNHILEQQIVRLMEHNLFNLNSDDIADWEERRREKKENDRKREEEDRLLRARQEEMRRNAEEAEKRNRSRANDANEDGKTDSFDESILVRLDRRANDSSVLLSTADTGLSCAVVESSMRVPREIAMANGAVLRCMVHRCAARLENGSETWCSRCARIVCGQCLAFDVTDIQSPGSQEIHKICVDCITQLVDVMESGDIYLRQKKVLLTRSLDSRHIARFSNRAALLQQEVVRHESSLRYAPHRAKIEETICGLEDELSWLQEKVKEAADRASAAREDRHDTSVSDHEEMIQKLMTDCDALEKEFASASSEEVPEDEEAAIRYFESFSNISFRLEAARMELATALSTQPPALSTGSKAEAVNESSNAAKDSRSSRRNNSPAAKIDALAKEYAELNSRLNSLLEQPLGEGEEASFARAVELSALETSLEEVQTRLAVANSTFESAIASNVPESVKNAMEDLEAIGATHNEWPLPLGLSFPSSRMEQQLEILRNTLDLRKVESERACEEDWARELRELDSSQDRLENEIARVKGTLENVERDAEEEERQARVRAEERRQRELARLERERILREQAEKAERERAELLARHREEEEATRAAFTKVAGEDNSGAIAFGGVGDLRMCKRCKAGPIENMACSDLHAHNDTSNAYKGASVRSTTNPNHCPNCGWFDADWHKWPYWDGVPGPH